MQKFEYDQEPYITTDKFSIYIPKPLDPVLDIIRKE